LHTRWVVSAWLFVLVLSLAFYSSGTDEVYAAQVTHLTLQVPAVVHIGDFVNMSAYLTDSSGNPIANGWITWYFNGQEEAAGLTSPSGYSGHSRGNWQSPLGTNTVSVTFNGTSNYQSSQAQAIVDVLPATTTNTQTGQTPSIPSGSTTIVQPITVQVEQIDALPLVLAIVAAGVIIAIAIIFASRMRK